ncbi:MAG TPA: hypothetical protein VH370_22925 [Humisphaera sp.]|jgi:hypothetical protein|nr:hypothetical protein [Humisphaera sp.]
MPLDPSPTAVIVAERVSPGFATDLSTWVFVVEPDGTATQPAVVANVDNMFRGEQRTFAAQLTETDVAELLAAAEVGGFGRLAPNYSADNAERCVSDLSTTALSFRLRGELKRVQVYGAGFLAYEGSEEMKVFCDLWQRIERHLPYGGA